MSKSGKTVLMFSALCLLGVGLQGGRSAAQTPGDGQSSTVAPSLGRPVGHWSFDQIDIVGHKAVDKSGNGHDGLIDGARPVAGRVGQALEFDGSEGSVTIDGLAIEGPELSVSLWLKKDTSAGGIRRLIFFDECTQVGFVDSDVFVHTGKPAKTDFNTPLADAGIVPARWHHLAVTWDTGADSDSVQVYVDGRLKLAADLEDALGTSLSVTRMLIAYEVANPWPAPSQVFAGAVDEVALYDTALSAQEIKTYFNEVVKKDGAEPPVAADAAPAGEVIRFPREPQDLYVPPVTYSGPKKLIRRASELGSRLLDAPSISEAELPAKVKIWQDTGFDGLIFSIASHDSAKSKTNMTGQWWCLTRRDYEQFVPEIKACQSVENWGRLTDNFLSSSIAVWGEKVSGYTCQDWFSDDDWDIIQSNVRLQARVARECGFKGIVLDMEQYVGHHAQGTWHIPFSYPLYAESGYKSAGEVKPRPFPEVAAKVRQRGTQYARAICSTFSGIRLMLVCDQEVRQWIAEPLEKNHSGLLPSFIDGLLLGLDEEATIIWASKLTYAMTRYKNIIRVRQSYDEAIELVGKAPDELKGKMSFAAGIWADVGGWSDSDVSVNARDPETHRLALRNAFKASGEYAWLYGEKSRFLTTEPTPLMRQYFRANVYAHELEGPPGD